MMFSGSDLRNANSFVKDAQADPPAASSSVSSALLRTCREAGWWETAGRAEGQLESPILTWSSTQRVLASQGNTVPMPPASPSSLCSLPAAPKVSPDVDQLLKTPLKINRNRLSKCGTHRELKL